MSRDMSSTVARTGGQGIDAPPEMPDPAVAEAAAPDHPARPARTCRCGHDRGHAMVSPNPKYSFLGWVAILIGISWEPESIDFTCRRCGEAFDRLTDPAEIKKVRLFG